MTEKKLVPISTESAIHAINNEFTVDREIGDSFFDIYDRTLLAILDEFNVDVPFTPDSKRFKKAKNHLRLLVERAVNVVSDDKAYHFVIDSSMYDKEEEMDT